jgi:hypothetical protein
MRPSLGITDGLPVLVMSAVVKPESNLDRPSSLFSSPVMLDIARTELEKVVSASAYAAPLTPVAHPPSRCFRHSSGTLRGEILVLWRPDFRLVANTIVRQRNSVTLQQWAAFGIIIAKWFWDVGTPPLIRSPGDLISMAIWQWALLALEVSKSNSKLIPTNAAAMVGKKYICQCPNQINKSGAYVSSYLIIEYRTLIKPATASGEPELQPSTNSPGQDDPLYLT